VSDHSTGVFQDPNLYKCIDMIRLTEDAMQKGPNPNPNPTPSPEPEPESTSQTTKVSKVVLTLTP